MSRHILPYAVLAGLGCGSEVGGSPVRTEAPVDMGPVVATRLVRAIDGRVRLDRRLFTGSAWTYYGGLEEVPKERQDYVLGQRHGARLRWFADGRLSAVTHYAQGRLHGLSTSYWSDGGLRAQSFHVQGKTQGVSRQWYEEGMPFKERQLVDGRERGLQRAWRRNGKLYANYHATGPRNYGLQQAGLCLEVGNP